MRPSLVPPPRRALSQPVRALVPSPWTFCGHALVRRLPSGRLQYALHKFAGDPNRVSFPRGARYLNTSPKTLARAARDGRLRYFRTRSRRWFTTRSALLSGAIFRIGDHAAYFGIPYERFRRLFRSQVLFMNRGTRTLGIGQTVRIPLLDVLQFLNGHIDLSLVHQVYAPQHPTRERAIAKALLGHQPNAQATISTGHPPSKPEGGAA